MPRSDLVNCVSTRVERRSRGKPRVYALRTFFFFFFFFQYSTLFNNILKSRLSKTTPVGMSPMKIVDLVCPNAYSLILIIELSGVQFIELQSIPTLTSLSQRFQ